MKKITNFTIQLIHLEGFGVIEIKEGIGGVWSLDLFPRGYENNDEMLTMETCLENYGDKYVRTIKHIREKLDAKNELKNY